MYIHEVGIHVIVAVMGRMGLVFMSMKISYVLGNLHRLHAHLGVLFRLERKDMVSGDRDGPARPTSKIRDDDRCGEIGQFCLSDHFILLVGMVGPADGAHWRSRREKPKYMMNRTPASHNTPRKSFLGVREGAGFPCRGTRAGRPGDGGGEKTRWLKLKREEVEESGPRSLALYEPARRRLRRGGVWVVRSISPGSRWVEVISIRGGDMRKEVLWRSTIRTEGKVCLH